MMAGESIQAYRPEAHATFRTQSNRPCNFRLARRDGVLLLQGEFMWEESGPQGRSQGSDWRDIETVEL